MSWKRSAVKLCLTSEILLVDVFLGIGFALFPKQISQCLDKNFFSNHLWSVSFAIVAVIGVWALVRSSSRLWRIFCCLNIFLLIQLSVAFGVSGSPTGCTTYLVLAYSAYLRSINVPAINLFWEGR